MAVCGKYQITERGCLSPFFLNFEVILREVFWGGSEMLDFEFPGPIFNTCIIELILSNLLDMSRFCVSYVILCIYGMLRVWYFVYVTYCIYDILHIWHVAYMNLICYSTFDIVGNMSLSQKKPPMCQIIRFSLYCINGPIEGRHID